MKFALGLQVGLMRFYVGGERSEMATLAVNPDLRIPTPRFFFVIDAKQPGASFAFMGNALVLHVDVLRHISEVAKPIVVSDTVYVVDLTSWPFAMHVEPCDAVGQILLFVDGDGAISVCGFRADYRSLL